jgi:PEP-CTERM motif
MSCAFSYVPRQLLLIAAWAGILIAANSALAASVNVPGQYTSLGPTYTIGTLDSNVTGGGGESGLFTLDNTYRYLLDDAAGREFRVFQVITYDDEPVTWQADVITGPGVANHTGTVVDVPSGGWDYESSTGNGGGDDLSPFYESDTANNPNTGNPYRFPGLSYPALHTADGTNPGTMSTSDAPGLGGANHQTLFETYIAYEDADLLGAMVVDVLAGYSWGVQTNGASVLSGIAPTNITYLAIDNTKLQELQDALDRSGYSDWIVVSNDVILIPEPGTIVLALFGLVGFGLGARFGRPVHTKN